MRIRPVVLALALLPGCTANPITGREQIMAIPVAQAAFADADFSLSVGAQRLAATQACAGGCAGMAQRARFADTVGAIAAQLEVAARDMSPDLFSRIGKFSIEIDANLGFATASSAGGRIVVGEGILALQSAPVDSGAAGHAEAGSGLGALEPRDVLVAFLLAREMAHVIARHAEENSGASLAVSALGFLLPGINVVARFIVSRISAGALRENWVAAQASEADDIALALLERCGLSAQSVSAGMQSGIDTARLPDDGWGADYLASAQRVARAAGSAFYLATLKSGHDSLLAPSREAAIP